MTNKKTNLISLLLAVFALGFAVYGYFALPQKIFIQLFSASHSPETETVWFLVIGALSVAACSAMAVFTEKAKKWIALETLLTLLFVGGIVYNLAVL